MRTPMFDATWHLPDPVSQPEFYADVPVKRLVAWVIDTILIALISALIVPFTFFTGIFFFPLLMLVSGFAYRIVTLANGSATLGMRLTALEFRDPTGARFDLSLAFWHTLGYSISFAIFPLQIISIVLMMTTSRAQGLSDHMLGTVALNRRAGY